MIADLKPYPAMKDSGVEWLGDTVFANHLCDGVTTKK